MVVVSILCGFLLNTYPHGSVPAGVGLWVASAVCMAIPIGAPSSPPSPLTRKARHHASPTITHSLSHT
jgi:hypothetical protein